MLETKTKTQKAQDIRDFFGDSWESLNNQAENQPDPSSTWVFWKKGPTVESYKSHPQFIYTSLTNSGGYMMIISAIYGKNPREDRKPLWTEIQQINNPSTTLPWMVVERRCSGTYKYTTMESLQNLFRLPSTNQAQLLEISSIGSEFTWKNNSLGDDFKQTRLDS